MKRSEESQKAKRIRNRIEHYLNIDISIRKRLPRLVFARALYFGLCRELTKLSLAEIGDTLNKNHATVLHGLRKVYSNFELWEETEYLDLYKKIKIEIASLEGGEKVEDLIKELVRLRMENNKLRDKLKI
jgi:chromosomal replication initiation ATPase DnaA